MNHLSFRVKKVMTSARSNVVLLTLATFLNAASVFASKCPADDLKQEFLTSGLEAWRQSIELHRSLNCTCIQGVPGRPGVDNSAVGSVLEVGRLDNRTLLKVRGPKESGDKSIVCNSTRYAFKINQEDNGAWMLEVVEPRWEQDSADKAEELIQTKLNYDKSGKDAPSEEPSLPFSKVFNEASSMLRMCEMGAFSVNGVIPVSALPWADPGRVQIESVVEKLEGDRRLMEVRATVTLDPATPLAAANGEIVTNIPTEQPMQLVMTLDADRMWIPLKCDVQYAGGVNETWACDYETEKNGIPLLTRRTRTAFPKDGSSFSYSETFTYPSAAPAPEEFTLAFYGLPEPAEEKGSVKFWLLVLVGLAVGAVGWRLLKNRDTAT